MRRRRLPARSTRGGLRRHGPVPGRGCHDPGQTWSAADAPGLHRQGRRAAGQVALPEVHLAFLKSDQVATVLDALGHHLGADPAAKRDESLDQGLLGLTVLVADAVDDLAIDLDDRRLERVDDREAGVARAGVVDGEAEAEAAERPNLLLGAGRGGEGLLLGAL